MNEYEDLSRRCQAVHKLTAWERRQEQDRLDEEIEECEYGFEPISYEQAQQLRQILYQKKS
jgi:hypothetical protein